MSAPTTRTYTKRHRSGNVTHWVKIEPGERVLVIRDDQHYRLGGQVDDVVAGNVLTECTEVAWCSVQQEWVGAGKPLVEPKP